MSVLVDTSVWVAHFKQRNEALAALLGQGRVSCHPHVIVEVACGTPPERRFVIDMLAHLDRVPVATHEELLDLLERRPIHGRGCGYVDVCLLASALMCGRMLWTLDRRLDAVASDLGVAYASVRRA